MGMLRIATLRPPLTKYQQDSANARLSACALPYISAILAIVIALIITGQVLGYSLARWRPKWTKPFVVERAEEYHESTPEGGKQRVGWVLCLLATSLIGFAAEIVQLAHNRSDIAAMLRLFSWVCMDILLRMWTDKPGSRCSSGCGQSPKIIANFIACIFCCDVDSGTLAGYCPFCASGPDSGSLC